MNENTTQKEYEDILRTPEHISEFQNELREAINVARQNGVVIIHGQNLDNLGGDRSVVLGELNDADQVLLLNNDIEVEDYDNSAYGFFDGPHIMPKCEDPIFLPSASNMMDMVEVHQIDCETGNNVKLHVYNESLSRKDRAREYSLENGDLVIVNVSTRGKNTPWVAYTSDNEFAINTAKTKNEVDAQLSLAEKSSSDGAKRRHMDRDSLIRQSEAISRKFTKVTERSIGKTVLSNDHRR